MQTVAEELLNDGTLKSGAASDLREKRYLLAQRLMDYTRFGEAMRILEMLGDYRNSHALLEEAQTLKAYQDREEARVRAEHARQAREREAQATRERRNRLLLWGAGLAALAVLMVLKQSGVV